MMLSFLKFPLPLFFALCCPWIAAFVPVRGSFRLSASQLKMGLFDGFLGADRPQNSKLDEEWEKQQEILRRRRGSPQDRDKYFKEVEKRRVEASIKQKEMWAWQTKAYKKGEDPIDEWRKRRANGQISDLDNQYGDPKKIGGIPLPGASFGVGGEFGVGGKFDNGGRFDLRLPYADQGYVDEDADFMGKFFGKNKPSSKGRSADASRDMKEVKTKKSMWPWEK